MPDLIARIPQQAQRQESLEEQLADLHRAEAAEKRVLEAEGVLAWLEANATTLDEAKDEIRGYFSKAPSR